MRTRSVLRAVAICTPLAALAGLLGFCAFAFSLADRNFDVRRGSFDYYVLIGATIRNVPLIEAQGEPAFHFRGGDGPKPTETEIAYVSKADPARLEAALARYLEGRGYRRAKNADRPPSAKFESGSVWFEIVVMRESESATKVWVTKFEL